MRGHFGNLFLFCFVLFLPESEQKLETEAGAMIITKSKTDGFLGHSVNTCLH